MATVVNLQAPAFLSMTKAGTSETDHLRLVTLPQQPVIVTPRVEPSPHALPVGYSPGATRITCEFANEQALTFTGGFATADGPDLSIVQDGLWMRTGRLYGGGLMGVGYQVGTQYYWEEGVFRLESPFLTLALGYHNADFPAGQLWLVDDSGTIRFEWRQANAAGDAVDSYQFDQVEVSLGSQAQGSVNWQHTYYRFEKSGGEISLYVTNSAGVGQTQTISSIPVPTVSAGALDGIHSLGKRTIDQRNIKILWWRASSSDIADVPMSAGTTWTSPVIYESPLTVLSHGDYAITWLDGGQNDIWWNYPSFPILAQPQGSTMRGKWVAANSISSGALDSLFSAAAWVDIPAGQQQVIELGSGGRQGRYLLMLLEWTPSAAVSLQGVTSQILSGAIAYSAQWQVSSWPSPPPATPDPVELQFENEPEPVGALPILPAFGSTIDLGTHAKAVQFEAPYSQSYQLRNGSRRSWNVTWIGLTEAERDTLRSFLLPLAPGHVFTWTDPEGATGVKASMVSGSLEWAQESHLHYRGTARFVERGV